MKQHCNNAQAVAEYLAKNEKVAWVNFAGLEGNKYYDLAQKYMPNGTCGVISFGLKGGREVSIKFMDSLKLAAIVTHVADARTSVLHPASHTHRQLSDEQLREAGVDPDLKRVYLTHKALLGTWSENASCFSQGMAVPGIIRGIKEYGIFVELTPARHFHCFEPMIASGDPFVLELGSFVPSLHGILTDFHLELELVQLLLPSSQLFKFWLKLWMVRVSELRAVSVPFAVFADGLET